MLTKPKVTNYFSEKNLQTVGPVEKVEGLEIGRVIFKRTEDGVLFSAMVIPMREIPVGSIVKITEISYLHNIDTRGKFSVVQ